MNILRFFKQAKYIKELEKIIKEHEGKAERRDCNISLLKKDLNQKSEIIIKLSKKLSELNKGWQVCSKDNCPLKIGGKR